MITVQTQLFYKIKEAVSKVRQSFFYAQKER
ncbi:hypothetical protein PMI13_03272, partial [Chryseobacterium populi]